MKSVFLMLIVTLSLVDPATVRKINEAKAEAKEAFQKGDYKTAIKHYEYLVDSLGVTEDAVMLNLASAYYLEKDTASAHNTYQSLTASTKPDIRSKANQQLGIMANQQGRSEEALNFFKEAIKAAPSNDDARYNYELLKKKLEEEKKKDQEKQQQNQEKENKDQNQEDQQNQEQQNKDQQEKDQQKKDEQDKDQQNKDQEQKDQEQKEQEQKEKQQQQKKEQEATDKEPNLDRDKLEEMKISEEKARMILEAMKNQEKQYLQEQRRRPSQPRDRNKPDW